MAPFEVFEVCFRVHRRVHGQLRRLARRDLDGDLAGHGRGDLVLQSEHINQLAIVTLRPQRFVGPASPWEAMVRALPFVRAAHVDDAPAPAPASLLVDLDDPDAQNPLLLRALINAGAEIRYAIPEQASLEEVYLRLIGRGTEGAS